MANQNIKIEVKDLRISFWTTQGMVRAVRGVDFNLYEKETLAIVGESGSGKSVTSRAIMGILAGNAVIDEGKIMYDGQDLTRIEEEVFHTIRGDRIGMIFQDPMSSLNPIMRIGKQITEGMLINGDHRKKEYKRRIRQFYNDYFDAKDAKRSERRKYREQLKKHKENGENDKIAELKNARKEKLRELNQAIKDARRTLIKEKRNKKKDVYAEYKEKAKAFDTQIEKAKQKIKEEGKSESGEWKKRAENVKQERDEKLSQLDSAYQKKLDDLQEQFRASAGTQKENLARQKRSEQERYKQERKALKKEYRQKLKEEKSPKAIYRQELSELKEKKRRTYKTTKKEAKERALKVMADVGIPEPEKRFRQYPFQFSGGMRQRIVIAVALTANPDVLICDEPTTALDVTIQAQILELIKNLKEERNLSVIFITHDLGVVANMADRVAVMYAGKIVEIGTVEEIFYEPKHPYTWALLSSMPDLNVQDRLSAIPGTPPNMLFPPKGDAFADRNQYAMKIDFEKEPPMFKVSDTHFAATWLLHKDAPKVELPDAVKRRIETMHKAPEQTSAQGGQS